MALALQQEAKLTDRWTPMVYYEPQYNYAESQARFNVLPAGRRSGKTEKAKRKLVKRALRATGPSPAFFAAAPVRDQAKRIYWDDLKKMIPKCLIVGRPSETELSIRLINGAKIMVIGMDRPERIEGTPWNGGILDEYANMKESAWMENVYPALTDRRGWCDLIGVPEGRNHYYEVYKKARADETGEWAAHTWTSAEVLPLYGRGAEVEAAREDLDPLTFSQEYEGSFVNFAGLAYYPFNEDLHCARLIDEYNPKAALSFCFDFNVDPGVAVIIQEINLPRKITPQPGVIIDGVTMFANDILQSAPQGTGILGEVHIPQNSNTPAVCRKLIQDWGDHQGRIRVFGDATGGARGTAQTEGSDWDLVKNALYDHYGRERVSMCVPSSNPTERSRVNAVNTRLKTGSGTVRMMVDPNRAPNTVKDFEGVRLLGGGSGELDKKHDPKLTHLSDAAGYYVVKEYPVRPEKTYVTELRV